MSHIVCFDPSAGTPEAGAPAADCVLAGAPRFRTWNLDEADGGLYAGIWEATPGKWRIVYEEWEYFSILSGFDHHRRQRSRASSARRRPDGVETWFQRKLGGR